jgi:organic radical activating enzyme
MDYFMIKKPASLGLLLTYKCNIACRDCIYNCSAAWKSDWLSIPDAKILFGQLAEVMPMPHRQDRQSISFSYGIHFTGGEPFLNYKLLRALARLSKQYGLAMPFVETNAFWADADSKTETMLHDLKNDGLKGILVSVNPFNIEKIPFSNTKRAAEFSYQVFGANAILYQMFYYDFFIRQKIEGTLGFEDFLKIIDPQSLRQNIELLPMGRTPYALAQLYRKYKAKEFFNQDCTYDLTRNHHVHIDNYLNYIPGFCAGISLGNARKLNEIFSGIDLNEKPVIRALLKSIKDLFSLGKDLGFQENDDGYISKCHLCFEIRKYLTENTDEFKELTPLDYYQMV